MKKIRIPVVAAALCFCAGMAMADAPGGISEDLLGRLRDGYKPSPAEKALRNAMAQTDINTLAANADARLGVEPTFTYRVKSKGITDQKQSGRCWLFTGLNVLRSQIMARHNLPELELSQNFNFFYDQLEKANLFLQATIDNASKPMDDKKVEWLFRNPISDGGQFTGVADIVEKYGVVPASVWPETYSSNNTSQLRRLLSLKLREQGLELRSMAASKAKPVALTKRKEEMLTDIYRMLARALGEPPTQFEWTRRNASGEKVSTRTYTPREFYQEMAGNNLKGDYVMLMNDPTRPYHKIYEIDLDRHTYDGENWRYVNLPVDEIKAMAIESLKDSAMMYFSCDVGQQFDRKRGVLDVDNYDYSELMGTEFGMDKADRIRTFASASSHAMTLVGVDLDDSGRPVRWLIENSWGPGANDGHLVMTDRWFDEYMFRLVVNRKYVPANVQKLLEGKSEILPAWDPMFSSDN